MNQYTSTQDRPRSLEHTVTCFLVGLGSNIDPEFHVINTLEKLTELFGVVLVSSVIRTEPFGMSDHSQPFLNGALALTCTLNAAELQRILHQLEIKAGRDRAHPQSSTRARPLDLDVLCALNERCEPSQALPDEPYVRPLVDELLHILRDAPSRLDYFSTDHVSISPPLELSVASSLTNTHLLTSPRLGGFGETPRYLYNDPQHLKSIDINSAIQSIL